MPEKHICPECENEYRSKNSLNKHRREKHGFLTNRQINLLILIIGAITLIAIGFFSVSDNLRTRMATASSMARCGICNNSIAYESANEIDHMLLFSDINVSLAEYHIRVIDSYCNSCQNGKCRLCSLGFFGDPFFKMIIGSTWKQLIILAIALLSLNFVLKRVFMKRRIISNSKLSQ